jgi:amino acid transporter
VSAPRLTWLTLALMTTRSVAGLRAAPTMAVYGLACVFLYLVPAIVFLLPTALVSAELASGWNGGVYNWVPQGLSKPLGFLAVWCLVTQGIVTTVIALMYAFIPNVSSAYWIFSVITTQVYLIVYLLMFVAAIRLRRNQPDHPRGYRAPALVTLCVTGFLASAAAMVIGFVPSSQFSGGSVWSYVLFIAAGLLVLGLVIPFAFLKLRKPSWRQAQPAAAAGGAA